MSSLSALVSADGSIRAGQEGQDVRALQLALSQAGYRIGANGDQFDGIFGSGTELVVKRFQLQHALPVDGIVGPETAAALDRPHAQLVSEAIPQTVTVPATGRQWPHDDTASLIAFYGDPDAENFEAENIIPIIPPFPITYEGRPIPHIQFHRKAAPMLSAAFAKMWDAAGHDPVSPILRRVSKFSGSYNNRPVRGSSRKSTHAFGAALDVAAEELPMGIRVDPAIIPREVVDAFDAFGFFWGNRYLERPDPMHWQLAHE